MPKGSSQKLVLIAVAKSDGTSRKYRVPSYKTSFMALTLTVGYKRFADSVDQLNPRSIITRGEMNDLWDEVLEKKWKESVVGDSTPTDKQKVFLARAKDQKYHGKDVQQYWAKKHRKNSSKPDHWFKTPIYQEPSILALLNESGTDLKGDGDTEKEAATDGCHLAKIHRDLKVKE